MDRYWPKKPIRKMQWCKHRHLNPLQVSNDHCFVELELTALRFHLETSFFSDRMFDF